MKKVGNHNSISRKIIFSLALLLAISFTSFSQATPPPAASTATAPATAPAAASGGDAVAGKALFNSNCAACHKLDAQLELNNAFPATASPPAVAAGAAVVAVAVAAGGVACENEVKEKVSVKAKL